MAITITQGMEVEFLGSGQIRPDLSSIGPILIPAGSVDHPSNPIGIGDNAGTNPPQSNLTGTWGSSWAPFVVGTTTGTVYASTDAVIAFIDPWQKSWIAAQMAGSGLATSYNVTVTGTDLTYDPGSGLVHLGTSYSSAIYWLTTTGSLAGSVGTQVAYVWDNAADVPTLTVYQLDADGGISIASQTAIDQTDWPTYAGLFASITGGVIDSMADIFVLYIYPEGGIASVVGYTLGVPNGPSGSPVGPQPGGGFIAIGGPILSPHPAPLPHPPTDVGTDYPTAPIGPPGYPGPYLPGYPIEYPEGYTSDQPLPGFPAYKQMLRGADVTSVINGFFVNMTQVLQLFADRGDSSFLRQEAVDMNGNSITNMAPATTIFELVTLAQVKAA